MVAWKNKAARSSETLTSVDLNARCHIPEDINLQNYNVVRLRYKIRQVIMHNGQRYNIFFGNPSG
jgi:hypothetical protein